MEARSTIHQLRSYRLHCVQPKATSSPSLI